MYKKIILILIATLRYSNAAFRMALEIGDHVPGEMLVLDLDGVIPDTVSILRVNATHGRPGFQKEYCYLRVTYDNGFSPVKVGYNKRAQLIRFMVKIPMLETKYTIVGFALPVGPTTTENITKKALRDQKEIHKSVETIKEELQPKGNKTEIKTAP